jgi:hypothetical protein
MAKRNKEKRRLEARALRKAMAPNSHLRMRSKLKVPPGLEGFTDEDHLFWLAHGVNYLASDYEKGIWTPLFEGLYEGKTPTPEEITRAVLERYKGEGGGFIPEAQPVLAWTVQNKAVIYVLNREAERAVKTFAPDCHARPTARLPKQPAVWEVFDGIRQSVLTPR